MNVHLPHFLADSDFPKEIVGVVVFIIWIISALAGGLKKKVQQQQRTNAPSQGPSPLEAFQREIAERLRQVGSQMQTPPQLPPRLPPQAVSRQPLSDNQRRQLQQRNIAATKKAKLARQPKRIEVPPPVPAPMERTVVAEEISDIQSRAALQPPRVKAPAVNAATLSRWMTPATLRQQFIITEIFQPPLSMRE